VRSIRIGTAAAVPTPVQRRRVKAKWLPLSVAA